MFIVVTDLFPIVSLFCSITAAILMLVAVYHLHRMLNGPYQAMIPRREVGRLVMLLSGSSFFMGIRWVIQDFFL